MKTEINKQTPNTKNAPVKTFKAGPVRAAIWENTSSKEENSKFNTISLDRSYKDKNGEWQKTSTLRVNDLPKAAIVLNKTFEYLIMDRVEKSVGN